MMCIEGCFRLLTPIPLTSPAVYAAAQGGPALTVLEAVALEVVAAPSSLQRF